MQGILYEADGPWLFLFLTIVLGGAAAFQAGRAAAQTWRPGGYLVGYALLLGAAVRFLHFALFNGTLLSPQYYLVDVVVLFCAALLGWRLKRVQQMARQYSWLYEPDGHFGWKAKAAKD